MIYAYKRKGGVYVITSVQNEGEGWFDNVIFWSDQRKWGISSGRDGENTGADPVVAYFCGGFSGFFLVVVLVQKQEI